MSLNDNIYAYCPKCNELNLQKDMNTIVCCGKTYDIGKGECCSVTFLAQIRNFRYMFNHQNVKFIY